MDWLKRIGSEIAGLFVEDGSFAAAIAVWLVVAAVTLRLSGLNGHWAGPILFAGLAVVLVESVLRFARKSR